MYELKLVNEVSVTPKNIHDLFRKNKVFVIGYGSLLYSDGWKGRGMRIHTKPEDLRECVITGYKRGPFGLYDGIHFYGVIPNKDRKLNAVLNYIESYSDWIDLMSTEFIAGMYNYYNYRVIDVTKSISGIKLPKDAVVHMVANETINERKSEYHVKASGYYESVWHGVRKERSKNFQNEFLATGGYNFQDCTKVY